MAFTDTDLTGQPSAPRRPPGAHARRRPAHRSPDRQGAVGRAGAPATRASHPGAVLRLLVLGPVEGQLGAVDLGSGAFLRCHLPPGPDPDGLGGDLAPFATVSAELAPDHDIPDPAQPEAVDLRSRPEALPGLRRRRIRRELERLVSPPARHLLGFPGPSTPFWTLEGNHPSMALVKAEGGVQVRSTQGGAGQAGAPARVRFAWGGVEQQLALEDRRVEAVLGASGRPVLAGTALEVALGFRPAYLLIAVTSPRNGHCYKTVAAVLPRP